MSNPFSLTDEQAYQRWRATRLTRPAPSTARLRVRVQHPAAPSRAELAAIGARIASDGMALISCAPEQLDAESLLALGRALGLRRTEANHFADIQAVSRITPVEGRGDGRGDYIPYTDRALNWHTDGYYNPPDQQVRAWMLFCLQPARAGGENQLLDPEIAYIRLRDDSPSHIVALTHPEAFAIPAHVVDGQVLRAESRGPVFSIQQGRLHMRYSARRRHVCWRDTPETTAARTALDELFSRETVFTFTHRLAAGEGLISNNVLHNRTAFAPATQRERARELLRIRYIDRVNPDSWTV
ncbi:taurine catabolism dioxygenase TauD [Marichromatium purpuratum 984]|uniref:Taurine catabolism dioxygenase TauD n=1 Tax=Marichromatium purpuratum 984 TaxID=765910 RepID=W0E0B9_MARPU|nr:TauD/TfdA family dioxygenase [Marichromatium purpuratum]AHF04305.1 taurine catabolism dioxygenase TauD [Marichromatium purpuratum 984]